MVWANQLVCDHGQSAARSENRALDAMLKVACAKGYTATRVEDVRAEAGLTDAASFTASRARTNWRLRRCTLGRADRRTRRGMRRILARATRSAAAAVERINHLRRYLERLLRGPSEQQRAGIGADVIAAGDAGGSPHVSLMED
jgi:hypothetical protein